MTGRGAKFGLPAAASIWSDRPAMRVWAMAGLLVFGGCFSDLGSGLVGSTSSGEATSGTSSTSGEPTSSSSSGETTMTPTTGEPPLPATCDPFLQDCPAGAKCAPYVDGGGDEWNANKCVPVTGDGTSGEACTYTGSAVSGEDSCRLGYFCSNGVCVALCGGTAEVPACAQGSFCLLGNGGVLSLCLATCDPLDPKVCMDGQACIEGAGADDEYEFVCFETGPLTAGSPCDSLNACAAGLFCEKFGAPNCSDDGGCCLKFCDLGLMGGCDEDAECLVYPYPTDYPDLGYCGTPVMP